MCGRYANHITDMSRWASILEDWPDDVPTGYNVAPSQTVPVFTAGESRGMRWGLIPHWAKDGAGNYATFNARCETLAAKPAFRDAWRHARRCLIPALGYYEWRTEAGAKQPYFVHCDDGSPVVFGGLWEAPADPQTAPWSCTIITRPAVSEMAVLHNRTPFILDPEQVGSWLNAPLDEAADFMREAPTPALAFHAVSREVNNARNQGAHLVESLSG